MTPGGALPPRLAPISQCACMIRRHTASAGRFLVRSGRRQDPKFHAAGCSRLGCERQRQLFPRGAPLGDPWKLARVKARLVPVAFVGERVFNIWARFDEDAAR